MHDCIVISYLTFEFVIDSSSGEWVYVIISFYYHYFQIVSHVKVIMASQLSSQLSFSLTEIRSDMLPGISSEDNEDDSTENSNLSSASVSDPGISSKANDDEEETQQNVSQRLT